MPRSAAQSEAVTWVSDGDKSPPESGDESPHSKGFAVRLAALFSTRAVAIRWVAVLVNLLFTASVCSAAGNSLPLAGQWRFQLDRTDVGIGERWFEWNLPDKIKLPGSLTEQGIGDPVTVDTKWIGGIVDKSWFTAPEYAPYRQPGNVKIPFWLQPELYCAGAAWFQRDIEIPADWKEKRVVLFLERAHWETRAWVDNRLVGTNNSLATPHEYDLGQLTPGKHTLTIRVDNGMVVDVGENSHCVSDHTQGNWNGIVGSIELRSTPLAWIEGVQVYPHSTRASVTVHGRIKNLVAKPVMGPVQMSIWETTALPALTASNPDAALMMGMSIVKWDASGATFEAELALGAVAQVWDEFRPPKYRLCAALTSYSHRPSVPFALREISTDGTQFTINGRKTFLRGTLDCCIFPKTGHPPMEVEEWRRIIRVAKSYGLNLIRFHSWCPPEAAFYAADELGFYFHVETCWPNQSTTLGDGKPVDQWIYDETDRILKYYGNHPSFLLMAAGNEPGGRNANAYLAKYVEHYKALDSRRLWSSGSGWPKLPQNQFHVTPDPRIQAWGGGLKTRINAKPPETTTDYRDYIAAREVPVISHEIGQWCVYPNFDEIRKYTGYLKPKNFEIFRDRLEANGLSRFAKDFLLASGKLQTLCYKEEIESALRTPGMGGFELLDLHDFPGQGTALVGVLDPFWEEKGYVTAKEFSRFCNATVPLARLAKRAFRNDEALEAEIEIANYGAELKRPAVVTWKLVGLDNKFFHKGELSPQELPAGGLAAFGKISVSLQDFRAPAHCKLVVGIAGTTIENDWDVWVYPAAESPESKQVLITAQFDQAAQQQLRAGRSVLLTIPGAQVRNFDTAPVKLGFSSIFWNTAWTARQAPTTLGILCDPKHPALADFPTEFHSDWQWWYLIHRAGALRLDLLPHGLDPIVRVIDDWVTARPLGLVVEGKVGAGKIVICGFDLTRDADDPVSRQMRASLVRYLDSKSCQPKAKLSVEQIQSLIADRQTGLPRGVKGIAATSEQEGYEARLAVDGDPATMWHSAWGEPAAGFPHELVVEFVTPRSLVGVKVLPRQDDNRNGWIKDYELCVSADGREWGQPVAHGKLPASASEQEIKLPAPITTRFLKLRALSSHSDGSFTSLAELSFIPATD